jgi:DNA polymerase-1
VPASTKQSVTQDDLKRLALKHPLAAKILAWRDSSTDLRFLREAAGATRIYPEWNVMSRTGRIYASGPPVQNVSKEICRPLLVPAPGCVLLKADYKQMQMRLLANFSGDPELVKAFREGKDVHWLTAEMCRIQCATDKEKRDLAKEVNFGILFQMTAWGLAQKLNTDISTAQGYIEAFWSKYSAAKQYLDRIVTNLKKKEPQDRYVESYTGRRRLFYKEFGVTEQRRVKATILQQAEADVLTLAFVSLQAIFQRRKMKSRIVMIIHDAIWVEAPKEEAEQARTLMEDTMQNAVEFRLVPLEVEFD